MDPAPQVHPPPLPRGTGLHVLFERLCRIHVAAAAPRRAAVGAARVHRPAGRSRGALLQDAPRADRRHRLPATRSTRWCRHVADAAPAAGALGGAAPLQAAGRAAAPTRAGRTLLQAANDVRPHGDRHGAADLAPGTARSRARSRPRHAVRLDAERAQGGAEPEPRAGALQAAAAAGARAGARGRRQGQRRHAHADRHGDAPLPRRSAATRSSRPLVADMPVALEDHGGAGNRITILQVPMGRPGVAPAQRLADVVRETGQVKQEMRELDRQRAHALFDRAALAGEHHRVAGPERAADARQRRDLESGGVRAARVFQRRRGRAGAADLGGRAPPGAQHHRSRPTSTSCTSRSSPCARRSRTCRGSPTTPQRRRPSSRPTWPAAASGEARAPPVGRRPPRAASRPHGVRRRAPRALTSAGNPGRRREPWRSARDIAHELGHRRAPRGARAAPPAVRRERPPAVSDRRVPRHARAVAGRAAAGTRSPATRSTGCRPPAAVARHRHRPRARASRSRCWRTAASTCPGRSTSGSGPSFQLWCRRRRGRARCSAARAPPTRLWLRAGGRLWLASYFPGEWADPSGRLGTPAGEYAKVSGGLSVLVLRWSPGTDVPATVPRLRAGHPRAGPRAGRGGALRPAGSRRPSTGTTCGTSARARSSARRSHPDGRPAIGCHTHGDVGILRREAAVPLAPGTRLRWSWRVDELPDRPARGHPALARLPEHRGRVRRRPGPHLLLERGAAGGHGVPLPAADLAGQGNPRGGAQRTPATSAAGWTRSATCTPTTGESSAARPARWCASG